MRVSSMSTVTAKTWSECFPPNDQEVLLYPLEMLVRDSEVNDRRISSEGHKLLPWGIRVCEQAERPF